MRHLDLFSGIGGFALAARAVGWQTVAFCESEPFCQAVLRKHWPDVPIHPDVRELKGDAVGSVDIITGGYPCQPFSLAGERRGAGDDRHLWPEFARLIRELRPRWVVGENVAGHISLGLDDVLSDLEGLGYAWEAFVIPAVAVDAKHRRDRIWIVANASERRRSEPRCWEAQQQRGAEAIGSSVVADRDGGRREIERQPQHAAEQGSCGHQLDGCGEGRRRDGSLVPDAGRRDWESAGRGERSGTEPARWLPEPDVGRVANGIPHRVDRLRALGNAIVPQVAEEIFRAIRAVTQQNGDPK